MRPRPRLIRLHLENKVSDIDLVRLADRLLTGHLAPVDVGAVGAFHIRDEYLPIHHRNSGVSLGDISFGQHHVVALHPADGDGPSIEVILGLLPTLFAYRYDHHEGRFSSKNLNRTRIRPRVDNWQK